jgi:hypothetical protein
MIRAPLTSFQLLTTPAGHDVDTLDLFADCLIKNGVGQKHKTIRTGMGMGITGFTPDSC